MRSTLKLLLVLAALVLGACGGSPSTVSPIASPAARSAAAPTSPPQPVLQVGSSSDLGKLAAESAKDAFQQGDVRSLQLAQLPIPVAISGETRFKIWSTDQQVGPVVTGPVYCLVVTAGEVTLLVSNFDNQQTPSKSYQGKSGVRLFSKTLGVRYTMVVRIAGADHTSADGKQLIIRAGDPTSSFQESAPSGGCHLAFHSVGFNGTYTAASLLKDGARFVYIA